MVGEIIPPERLFGAQIAPAIPVSGPPAQQVDPNIIPADRLFPQDFPEKQTVTEDERGLFSRTIESISEAIAPSDIEDLPEIRDLQDLKKESGQNGFFGPDSGVIGGQLGLGQTDEEKAGIATRVFPLEKLTFREGRGGTIAKVNAGPFEGREFFLNKKGLTRQDFTDLRQQATFEAASTFPAFRGAAGAGILVRGGAVGAAATGGNILQQLAAQQAGSQEPIDIQRAAETGTSFALFQAGGELGVEALRRIGPIVTPVIKKVLTEGKFLLSSGDLSPAGREALQIAGVKPDEITPEIASLVRQNVDLQPEQIARLVDADQLPERVQLTRGQVTQDVREEALEGLAERGRLGPEALGAAEETLGAQREQLELARAGIQQRIAGQRPVITTAQAAAEAAQAGAAAQRDILRTNVNELFQTVRDFGDAQARISSDFIQAAAGRAKQQINTVAAESQQVLSNELLQDFRKLTSNVQSVPLEELEAWRRRATNIGGQRITPDERAVGELVKFYDEIMDEAVDKAILAGDPKSIEFAKNAVKKSAQLKRNFGPRQILGKFVEETFETGAKELKVSPDDAVSFLFGAGDISGKAGLSKVVSAMKRELTPDAFNDVQQAAYLRLFRDQPAEGFDEKKIVKQINNFFERRPAAAAELFNKDQIRDIRRLGRVASNIARRPGTKAESAKILADINNSILTKFGRAVSILPFSGFGLRDLGSASARNAAIRLISGRRLRQPEFISGGIIGQEREVQDNRSRTIPPVVVNP